MVIIQHPQEPNDKEPGKSSGLITFGGRRDGGKGYLAQSQRVGPGVVLLHQWYGLQPSFQRMADRLRDEGFTVLVPDLFDGFVAADDAEAEAKAAEVESDPEAVLRRVEGAARFLTDNWHPRVGLIGHSFGAYFGAQLAQRFPLEAVVLYYGYAGIPDPGGWTAPVLVHLAETDPFVEDEDVVEVSTALDQAGVEHEWHTYPGTGHSFANEDVAAYDQEAAELAHERTVEFLHHHLA
ncbi:MAG: dienelactone hydrolase family protein [Actinomycetota bacterium]